MKNVLLCTAVLTLASLTQATAQITFTSPRTCAGTIDCNHIAKCDINHDGRTDIVGVVGYPTFQVLVLKQDTSANALDTPVRYDYTPVYPGARAIAAGDVSSDGWDDVVIGFADSIGIFYQTSLGLSAQVSYYTGQGYTDAIKIRDMDNDGHNDIIVSAWSGNSVIFYGSISGTFTRVSYATAPGAGYDDLEVAKLGTDSLYSIIAMGGQTHAPIQQVRIHSDRSVDTTITFALSVTDNMHGVGVGDFYGTGDALMAASYGGDVSSARVAVWRHPSLGGTADTSFASTDAPQPVEAGKMDGSGRDQIVVLHGGKHQVTVTDMVMGTYTFYIPCPNNAMPDGLVLADVNGDGQLDIVSGNTYAGIHVLLNTTAQSTGFSTPLQFPTIKLYPNPTTQTVWIEMEGSYVVKVFNQLGQAVAFCNGSGKLALPELEQGTYTVLIYDSNGLLLKKELVVKL